MLDDPYKLFLGLITGIAFGFLLQKGQVAKFRVIMGQLLLKDWTVVKIMASAVAVGTVGVHLLVHAGMASFHVQEALWARIIPGAVLFGIGMAMLGLCPGTSVAACGQGSKDAFAGVAGMFAGALLYVGLYPAMKGAFQAWGNMGEVRIPELAGLPTLITALLVAATIAVALRLFSYHQTSRRSTVSI